MAILVKTEITITKGFDTWKKMVESQTSKLEEMGISFLFAGTERDDPTKLHAAMRFDSLDVLKGLELMRNSQMNGARPGS